MHRDPRYPWDFHSDQPHILRDRSFKRALYRRGAVDSLKTAASALALPLALHKFKASARSATGTTASTIGVCVNPGQQLDGAYDYSDSELAALVDELGIADILIRLPLADIENIARYRRFAESFSGCNVVFNLLQDRRHIEDRALLLDSLHSVFTTVGDLAQGMIIGNAVNRRKWAFVSLDEYFDFFACAQQVRDALCPDLELAGGSIIDFELPNFARAVQPGRAVRYDTVAAELYVDRRGAPENRQLGCDLLDKIRWFHTLAKKSASSSERLWINEVNWPLKGTEPWAPATGDCMVDEDQQARYLARYYLLAIASGKIEKCFWHQLVAPGYGLVDSRGDTPRKRRAWHALKTLQRLMQGATLDEFSEYEGVYTLEATGAKGRLRALWTNDVSSTIQQHGFTYSLDMCGKLCTPLNGSDIAIGGEPVYLLQQNPGAVHA